MSFDSFEDFFETGKTDKSKIANLEMITRELMTFNEKIFTELATIVDQLDAKVTSIDQTIKVLRSKIDNLSRVAASPPPMSVPISPPNMGISPAPSHPASMPGLPPPPSPSGVPSLPGLSPPPAPGSPFGVGLTPPPPATGNPFGVGLTPPPPADDPLAKPSPMAAQAAIRNELQEAFKKIRQNLKEDS